MIEWFTLKEITNFTFLSLQSFFYISGFFFLKNEWIVATVIYIHFLFFYLSHTGIFSWGEAFWENGVWRSNDVSCGRLSRCDGHVPNKPHILLQGNWWKLALLRKFQLQRQDVPHKAWRIHQIHWMGRNECPCGFHQTNHGLLEWTFKIKINLIFLNLI